MVLIPFSISNRYFPGVLEEVRSVNFLGANEPETRDVFIEAYYDGTFAELVPGGDVEAVLGDLGVDYVVVPPRSELNDEARRFASYESADFLAVLGDPELISFSDSAAVEVTAWAFDDGEEERIGGVQFTVPGDMDHRPPRQ